MTLSPQDQQLIQTASDFIKHRFLQDHHHLATAIRTTNNDIILGFNMEGSFGCNDICAEQIALGKALSEGKTQIETMVTVRHPEEDSLKQEIEVVNPCGKCRELILDYAPKAFVIMQTENSFAKFPAKELLPNRYQK